jgi:hypothetical protein
VKLIRQAAALSLVLLLGMAAGCSDPYSVRRIQMRQDALHDQAEGVITQERHNAERWNNELPAIRDQLRRDTEMFRQRAPTVGDYVW